MKSVRKITLRSMFLRRRCQIIEGTEQGGGRLTHRYLHFVDIALSGTVVILSCKVSPPPKLIFQNAAIHHGSIVFVLIHTLALTMCGGTSAH